MELLTVKGFTSRSDCIDTIFNVQENNYKIIHKKKCFPFFFFSLKIATQPKKFHWKTVWIKKKIWKLEACCSLNILAANLLKFAYLNYLEIKFGIKYNFTNQKFMLILIKIVFLNGLNSIFLFYSWHLCSL